MIDNNIINKNLGLKIFKEEKKEILNRSVKKNFNINSINNFSPIFNLFTNNFIYNINFNNSRQIIKLKKKKRQVHINGGIYVGEINYINKKYFTNIFVKESNIVNLNNISINSLKNSTDEELYLKSYYKYNLNSSSNIELFILYITSKLYELDISPNFQLFYGFSNVNMKKLTTELENKEELNFYKKIIKSNRFKIKIFKNNKRYYVERYNMPCLLLYSEVLDSDLHDYIRKSERILEHEWCSYIFQIIAGLTTCQKYFNLCHNDLHIANIMYKYTEKKYLYFEYENKIYRIHTYNKILKIIDWGRGTYDFNNFKGQNTIYNSDGDAYGQYIHRRINNKGKKPIDYNLSTDLVIFGSNILNNNLFPKKGNLRKLVKKWLQYDNSSIEYIDKNEFDLYIKAAKFCKNAVPKNQIEESVFNKFIIDIKCINKDEKIYKLD